MELIKKIGFKLKKKKVILIFGEGRKNTQKMVIEVLKKQKEKEILVLDGEEIEISKIEFYLINSSLPILILTHTQEIFLGKDHFPGDKEKVEKILSILKKAPSSLNLIFNFDDESLRKIVQIKNFNTISFGFNKEADIFASDLKLNHGTNFKVNFKGGFVPFWLEKTFGKAQIYAVLAVCGLGKILKINLVEISQALKDYRPGLGEIRLIEGIKESWILDNSEAKNFYFLVEAIEIFKEIEGFSRKIGIFGGSLNQDFIFEKISKNIDFLFIFDKNAEIFAKKAIEKGIQPEKIFYFKEDEGGIEKLKEMIRRGDLIFINGLREEKMKRFLDQLRKIW